MDASPLRQRAARLGGHARDLVLVVLGALLALAADEWREARQRRERVRVTVAGIREEIRANSALVSRAREKHLFLRDTLEKLRVAGALPPPKIWAEGIWSPAQVTSTAWEVARETGALADIPPATVLALAKVYGSQENYSTLADELNVDLMNDVRQHGMEVVLRDRFVQFVPLAVDFSNRERALLRQYERVLALPELK